MTIVKEIVEKGVSECKVSVNDREGLQEVRRLVAQKAFDVLLVFMFDRIGRREDEVPVLVRELGDSGGNSKLLYKGKQNKLKIWESECTEERGFMRKVVAFVSILIIFSTVSACSNSNTANITVDYGTSDIYS